MTLSKSYYNGDLFFLEIDTDGMDGWDGMGWTGREIKSVFYFFFILRYIKQYTYTNLYWYENVLTNFLWVLKFGQVGGPDK